MECYWVLGQRIDFLATGVEGHVEVLFEDAARMLSGFVPSGFEWFFRDFGHSARLEDVEPRPVQEQEIRRLKATASEYDMELGRGDEPPVPEA